MSVNSDPLWIAILCRWASVSSSHHIPHKIKSQILFQFSAANDCEILLTFQQKLDSHDANVSFGVKVCANSANPNAPTMALSPWALPIDQNALHPTSTSILTWLPKKKKTSIHEICSSWLKLVEMELASPCRNVIFYQKFSRMIFLWSMTGSEIEIITGNCGKHLLATKRQRLETFNSSFAWVARWCFSLSRVIMRVSTGTNAGPRRMAISKMHGVIFSHWENIRKNGNILRKKLVFSSKPSHFLSNQIDKRYCASLQFPEND